MITKVNLTCSWRPNIGIEDPDLLPDGGLGGTETLLNQYGLASTQACIQFLDPSEEWASEEWEEQFGVEPDSKLSRRKLLNSFATLWSRTDASILEYASARGCLNSEYAKWAITRKVPGPGGGTVSVLLEPISVWRLESAHLCFLLCLVALSKVPSGPVLAANRPTSALLASSETHETWSDYALRLRQLASDAYKNLKDNDVQHFQEVVSKSMYFEADLTLKDFQTGNAQDSLGEQLASALDSHLKARSDNGDLALSWSKGKDFAGLKLEAWTLLGATTFCWLVEFSEGAATARLCARPGCERQLPAFTATGRPTPQTKRFCSNTCQRYAKRHEPLPAEA